MATDPRTTNKPTPLTATCHCTRIQLHLPSKPQQLNECCCTVCFKYGALWAYFPRREVSVVLAEGATLETYVREDEGADGDISFNRCGHCGCMMLWRGEGEFAGLEHKMGVNCRMLPKVEIDGIERRVSKGP